MQTLLKSNNAMRQLIVANQSLIDMYKGGQAVALSPEGQFEASPTFEGLRKGAVFKAGDRGVGYYLDTVGKAAPTKVQGTVGRYEQKQLPDGKFTCSCAHHQYRISKPVSLAKACKHVREWNCALEDQVLLTSKVPAANVRGTVGRYEQEQLPDGKFKCSCAHHKYRICKPVSRTEACKHVRRWQEAE